MEEPAPSAKLGHCAGAAKEKRRSKKALNRAQAFASNPPIEALRLLPGDTVHKQRRALGLTGESAHIRCFVDGMPTATH